MLLPRQEGQLIPDYYNWVVKLGKPIYLDITLCYSVCKCCSPLCFFKFWRQKILVSGSCLPVIRLSSFYLHSHKCQLLSLSNFLDSPVFAVAISGSGSGCALGERRVLWHEAAGLAGSEVMQCSANGDAGMRTYPDCKPHWLLPVGMDGAMHVSGQ